MQSGMQGGGNAQFLFSPFLLFVEVRLIFDMNLGELVVSSRSLSRSVKKQGLIEAQLHLNN